MFVKKTSRDETVYLLPEQIEKIAEETVKSFNPKLYALWAKIVEPTGAGRTFAVNECLMKTFVEMIKMHTHEFSLDETLEMNDKDAIITFLLDIENIFIANQIRIAHNQTKKWFPHSRVKLELRSDPENGNDCLYFLIQSHSKHEEEVGALNSLYEVVTLGERFIVDLDVF